MTAETREERRERRQERRERRKERLLDAAEETGCCLFEGLAAVLTALVLIVLPAWLWLE